MSPGVTLLDVPTVARVLSVRAATVRAWIARGDLPAVRLGRTYRVRESTLSRWITAHEVRGCSTVSTRAHARDGLGAGESASIWAGRRGIDAAPTGQALSPERCAADYRPAGPSIDSVSAVAASQSVAVQGVRREFGGKVDKVGASPGDGSPALLGGGEKGGEGVRCVLPGARGAMG